MSTPSDTLRAAATRIREVAQAATPGPWVSLDGGDRIIRDVESPMRSYFVDGTRVTEEAAPEYVVDEPLHANPANGEHIALWHPLVAVTVATWLEATADHYEPIWRGPNVPVELGLALATANAVLGEVTA